MQQENIILILIITILLIRSYLDLKDFKKTDLFSCQHPKRIFNHKTNSFMVVPCGICQSCLLRLARKSSMLCDVHESFHKYCMFVTLTYRKEDIPLMRMEKREVVHRRARLTGLETDEELRFTSVVNDFYDVTERFSKRKKIFGDFLFTSQFSDFYMSQMYRKFRYFGQDIPYLSKYDAQCFIKRFRKHLSKFTDEKISYYIVGEYGPVHFRPHFHVLLFFDSDTIFENFEQVLSKSWKFGLYDFSLSRKQCSSYVASYVNQRASIPRLFANTFAKPFALHSQNFAIRFFKDKKKEIYENEPSYFVQYLCSEVLHKEGVTPWRSLVNLFFPKCRDYASKDSDSLLYSYTLLSRAQKFYEKVVFDSDSLVSLSNAIFNDIFVNYNRLSPYVSDFRGSPFDKVFSRSSKDYFLVWIVSNVLTYDKLFIDPILMDKSEIDRCLVAIQSDLRLSRHFLNFVCDNQSYSEIHYKLGKIVSYYDYVSYRNLCLMYEHQQKVCENVNPFTLPLLDLFYDNTPVDLDNLQEYDGFYEFLSSASLQYYNATKHKTQNDLNEIFC